MSDPQSQPAERHDVVVVGAGFAGLYLLHRLRGMGLSARVFERAAGVGGTWWWNRYPGARCDVESLQYSYSWDPELERDWTWSETLNMLVEETGAISGRIELIQMRSIENPEKMN